MTALPFAADSDRADERQQADSPRVMVQMPAADADAFASPDADSAPDLHHFAKVSTLAYVTPFPSLSTAPTAPAVRDCPTFAVRKLICDVCRAADLAFCRGVRQIGPRRTNQPSSACKPLLTDARLSHMS